MIQCRGFPVWLTVEMGWWEYRETQGLGTRRCLTFEEAAHTVYAFLRSSSRTGTLSSGLSERWPSDPTREGPAAFYRGVGTGELVRRFGALKFVECHKSGRRDISARAFQNQVQLLKPRGIKHHNKAW